MTVEAVESSHADSRALLASWLTEPPPWALATILAWDAGRAERVKPFVRHKYWTDRGSVNVFRVIGTQHPSYQGLTWWEFFQRGVRMRHNLALYRDNPGYYTETTPKRPGMYYVTLDGGLSYYIAEDGNHRTAIARLDCWRRQDCELHGVIIQDLRIDWELWRSYERLVAWQQAHPRQFAGLTIQPVAWPERREDGPGWMLETFQVQIQLGEGRRTWTVDAPQAMAFGMDRQRARRWWSLRV